MSGLSTLGFNNQYPVPIGSVFLFAGATDFDHLPADYLICNGDIIPIVDYPELYAVLGNTWGASTATDFHIPDLRLYYPKGAMNSSDTPVVNSATAVVAPITLSNTQLPTIPNVTASVGLSGTLSPPASSQSDPNKLDAGLFPNVYACQTGTLGSAVSFSGTNNAVFNYVNGGQTAFTPVVTTPITGGSVASTQMVYVIKAKNAVFVNN